MTTNVEKKEREREKNKKISKINHLICRILKTFFRTFFTGIQKSSKNAQLNRIKK